MADFLGMMKQAAQLQSKMQAMQAELDRIEVEGTAGGGMVTVKLTAKGEMKGVKIDDSLIKPDDKEILEDLLVAAHADARRKAEERHAGQDEGPDRRPAAAAGTEAVLDVVTAPTSRSVMRRARARASTPCVLWKETNARGCPGSSSPAHDELDVSSPLQLIRPWPNPPPDPRSSA